jgi:prepilin-type N-terminal cleavage/methylation domain-containing protein
MKYKISSFNIGFTLLELSISLVVISLLMSAAISGKNLIDAAKMKKIYSEKSAFEIGIVSFKTKYGFLPGSINAVEKSYLLMKSSSDFANITNIDPNIVDYYAAGGAQAANAMIMLKKSVSLNSDIIDKFDVNINGGDASSQWKSFKLLFPAGGYAPESSMWFFGLKGSTYTQDSKHRMILASSIYPYSSQNSEVANPLSAPVLNIKNTMILLDKFDNSMPNSGNIRAFGHDNTLQDTKNTTQACVSGYDGDRELGGTSFLDGHDDDINYGCIVRFDLGGL